MIKHVETMIYLVALSGIRFDYTSAVDRSDKVSLLIWVGTAGSIKYEGPASGIKEWADKNGLAYYEKRVISTIDI